MKRKILSVLFALVLVCSFSLVTAVPVSASGLPTIDGAVNSGEWDGAVEIPVTAGMGTVKLLASTDYLYVLFDVIDTTDARLGQNLKGNDQISINVNPTDGGSWGFPYDLIFETSADLPWNPKDNSGIIDGWNTRWFPNNAQEPLPSDLESATIYSGGKRITEWKLPLATINPSPGDTLKVGGAIEVGDGNSYVYPIDLVWSTASTFAEYSYRVNNQDTGLYYQIIQAAINAADPYNTILVHSGTYHEYILIDKPLTVESNDGAEKTTIDGIGFRYTVRIYSSNVTFEGFTATNPTYEGGADATGILVGAYLEESVDNVRILNNIVKTVRSGTSGTPSMYGATGINVGRAPLSNVVISGNNITDIHNPEGASVDHTCGINVWDGADGVEISNNTISDIKYNGIILECASNVQIEENSITECESGIRVDPYKGATLSGLAANFNNITGNTYGVQNMDLDTFDAQYNWWGSANGPGQEGANPVSVDVDFSPWLPGTWQTYYDPVTEAEIDSDEDDFSDLQEYWLGTNPEDEFDFPGADVEEVANVYAEEGGDAETETTNAAVVADAAEGKSGSVNLAEYADTPVEDESIFGAVGKYVDVHTDTPENFEEVEVRVNYDEGSLTVPESSLRMYYWDAGVGDWCQCSDQGVKTELDYIWAKIRDDTVPDLSYLAGGPFGGGNPTVELDSEWYKTGDTVEVTIEDATESGLIAAFAWSDTVGDIGMITLALTETDTGIFEGSFDLVSIMPGVGEVLVNDGDLITVAYLGVLAMATVDDTAPEINIVSPEDSALITDPTPEIAASYSDVGSVIDTETVRMALDGAYAEATVTESSVTYTPLADLAEGTWFVTIDVSDAVGNWAMPASWSFTVDTELPVITQEKATPTVVMPDEENTIVFTANVVDVTSGIVSVTIDLSDIGEGTLDMLDGGISPDAEEGDDIYSAEITTTITLEKQYTLPVTATDLAGSSATADITLVVSSDTESPVITSPQITYPIGAVSARVDDPVVVSAVVTDNGVLETVTLSATSAIFFDIGEATDTVDMTAEEGSDLYQTPSDLVVADGIDADSYELTITAEDDKGNTATDTLTLVVTTKLTGYNIELAEGWNLISLPLIPDPATTAIATMLASISENVDIVWGYDPVNSPDDPWAMYVPGVIEDDLAQMVDGMGYWVYMTGSATLTISGIEMPEPPTAPPAYDVAAGWNLMGVKDVALEGIDYNDYLISIAGDYSVIWGYDPETGYFSVHPLEGNEKLSAGQGCWLWMDTDGIIVPPR